MAQQDAGFESPNAFREAFAKLLGASPSQFRNRGLLLANWLSTPLGDMICVSSVRHLHLLEFVDRKALPSELKKLRDRVKGDIGIGRYAPTEQIEAELGAFFKRTSAQFDTPLALHGSNFTRSVWAELRTIAPRGTPAAIRIFPSAWDGPLPSARWREQMVPTRSPHVTG